MNTNERAGLQSTFNPSSGGEEQRLHVGALGVLLLDVLLHAPLVLVALRAERAGELRALATRVAQVLVEVALVGEDVATLRARVLGCLLITRQSWQHGSGASSTQTPHHGCNTFIPC